MLRFKMYQWRNEGVSSILCGSSPSCLIDLNIIIFSNFGQKIREIIAEKTIIIDKKPRASLNYCFVNFKLVNE